MTELKHQEHVDEVLNILDRVEDETDVSISVEPEAIDDRLEEFVGQRIEPDEGVRYVSREILRDAGVSNVNQYIQGGAGSRGNLGDNEQLVAEEIVEPDRWIAFEGTVIDLYEPSADAMVQNGVLADETGTIRFTVWEDNDGENTLDTELEQGKSYRLEPVVTNLFEQADQMELKLREATEVTELEGDDALDIDPETYTETVSGAIVSFQAPMGLVDRCPNQPECGRVVNQRDHCPDCGDIEAEIDLRTKAVLDTGAETFTVILNAEQTEREANLSLEDAEELVREHNDREVVRQYIEAELHGEYLHVHGMSHGRNFQVESVELIDPPAISDLDTIEQRLEELP